MLAERWRGIGIVLTIEKMAILNVGIEVFPGFGIDFDNVARLDPSHSQHIVADVVVRVALCDVLGFISEIL